MVTGAQRLSAPAGEGQLVPGTEVRIRGLVQAQRLLHERLRQVAGARADTLLDTLPAVHADILEILSDIGIGLERAGAEPGMLPDPSRRAYQWLSYLSDRPALEEHLVTLQQAIRVDPRPEIEIAHIPGLYRGYRHEEDIRLSFSEGFVGAPEPIITGLVKLSLPYTRKKQHRAAVHDYAESEGFRQRLRRLETAGGAAPPRISGENHNLETIFLAVNRDYFGNRLAMPRIRWNKISTLREYGRYEPTTDSIVLSRRLDAPDVPEQVVAYVLYHELLHWVMGSKREGGRRRYHTAAFRRAEERFRGHDQAERFLETLSRRGRQYSLTSRFD